MGAERVSTIRRIVSGGQTGVDRAALACAIDHGYDVGGFCPEGYRAEDGTIPERFRRYLTPTASRAYSDRTRRNVELADATLIVARGPVVAGTALTRAVCRELGKPCLVIDVDDGAAEQSAVAWLSTVRPRVLNVAGPRESTSPGIGNTAYELLSRILRRGRAPERGESANFRPP